jgi:hypothetical protein
MFIIHTLLHVVYKIEKGQNIWDIFYSCKGCDNKLYFIYIFLPLNYSNYIINCTKIK